MSFRSRSRGRGLFLPASVRTFAPAVLLVLAACGGGGGGGINTSGLVRILTTAVPAGSTGVEYNAQFFADVPHPPGNFAVVAGALPPGLTLDKSTGSLTGYPRQVGTFSFTLAARDGIDPALPPGRDTTFAEDRKPFVMTMARGLPNILPQSPPPAQYRAPYGYQIDVAGGTPPYAFAKTGGDLPNGLQVTSGGFLGSFPVQAKPEPYVFQVTVTDAQGLTDTQTLEVSVAVLPLIIETPSPLPPAAFEFDYTQQFTLASGGAGEPYTWSQSLPAGPGEIDLASIGMEVTTQGVLRPKAPAPGPTQVGTFQFTVQVQDEALQTASRAFQLTVNPGPVLSKITPNKAAKPGPYDVTGLNFQPGVQLIFKPGPTEVVILPTYITSTLLRFTNAPPAPAGAGGFVTVRVKNTDGGYYDLPSAFAFPATNLSFSTTPNFPSPQSGLSSTGLDVADVDKDGFADVVHCGTGDDGWSWGGAAGTNGGVDLLVNLHPGGSFDGTFRLVSLDSGGLWHQVRFTDVDTDGDLDVVAVGTDGGSVFARTWFNPYPSEWNSPDSPVDSYLPYVSPYTIHVSDMDVGQLSSADTLPDLAYVMQQYPTGQSSSGYYGWQYLGGALTSVEGAGNGTFTNQMSSEVGSISHMTSAAAVALGDLDGDAVDDVALGDQCGGWSGPYSQGQFALSTPSTGVFGAFTPLVRAGSQGYSENLGVAVGDVSGDGQNDIVIGSGSNDSWSPNSGLGVWQGNGSGTFSVVTPQAGTSSALYRYVVPFDADFDLSLDVAATFDGGRIDIWKGRSGTLGLQWKQVITLASGTPEFGRIAAGDFNGDGKDDLCTALSFLADTYPNNGFDTPNSRGLGGTQGVVIYLNTSQ